MIILIKLKQINLFLSQKQNNFLWSNFAKYQEYIREVMEYFDEYNKLYGWLFLVFILVNYPVSAYLIIYLIYGKVSMLTSAYIGYYSAIQLAGLFAIHYYLVRFSDQFHESGKILLNVMAKSQHKIGHTRARMMCTNAIGEIHTQNRVGITYGRIGLVTIQSFVKVYLVISKYYFS